MWNGTYRVQCYECVCVCVWVCMKERAREREINRKRIEQQQKLVNLNFLRGNSQTRCFLRHFNGHWFKALWFAFLKKHFKLIMASNGKQWSWWLSRIQPSHCELLCIPKELENVWIYLFHYTLIVIERCFENENSTNIIRLCKNVGLAVVFPSYFNWNECRTYNVDQILRVKLVEAITECFEVICIDLNHVQIERIGWTKQNW